MHCIQKSKFRDHPRLRGEQMHYVSLRLVAQGSPPLARGTGLFHFSASISGGITPACAGNRSSQSAAVMSSRDHPRLRGEQNTARPLVCQHIGSPPLARGTAGSLRRRHIPCGITPACAGNSALCFIFPPARRDHPRLRGEQHTVST